MDKIPPKLKAKIEELKDKIVEKKGLEYYKNILSGKITKMALTKLLTNIDE